MPKYKNKILSKILLFVLLITAGSLLLSRHTHAQSMPVGIYFDWVDGASSCYGTANGETQAYYGAVSGDSITLNITNVSATYDMTIDITESGQSAYSHLLLPGESVSPVYPANSEIVVMANGSVCTSGHGGPGSFSVEVATGSMSCTIANNQVWTVSLNYSGVFGLATLYRESTLVAPFQIKANVLVVPEEFSAQSTPATYYLYYQPTTNTTKLLGQATCPAKTVASSPKPSTTPSKTPAATNSTPTVTPTKSDVTAGNTTNTQIETPTTTKNVPVIIAKKKFNWQYVILAVAVPGSAAAGYFAWKFRANISKRLGKS